MSIRSKVIGSFVGILILFASVSTYNYVRLSETNKHLILVNEIFIPLSRLTAELQGKIYTLAEDMQRFYFFSDGTSEQSTFSRLARDLYPYLILRKFNAAETLLAKHTSEMGPMINELTALIKRAKKRFEQLSVANEKKQFRKLYVELRSDLRMLSKQVDDQAQRITLAAQTEGRDNLFATLSLSTLIAIFGILTILFSSKILKPLPTLIESLRKIADGDFHQSLKFKVSSKDEISLLAREYNRMLDALCERDKKIQLQQKELLQAERLAAVGQLSAEVVHEIRNPLNSINLNIDWLRSEIANQGPETTKTLRSISKEIERLYQITESYLVRARIPIQDYEKTEVHDVLNEILDFSKEEDRSRKIIIERDLVDKTIYVNTTRTRLKQVFLNILKNAKESMPCGGTITVRTRVNNNVSSIEFSDTGYGMNKTTRSKTFTPFYTTKPNGTGLGLMLTKNIVEEALGTIHCDSQMGKGTTFTFQFPI